MEPLSNKYDALLEDSSNETSIVSHYASIIELKKSQAKINLLISLEETAEDELQQLKAMQENIETALREEISTLREKEKRLAAYPMSIQLLAIQDVGKLAKCFIEVDKRWKNSVVIEVDVEAQTARVRRYGSNQILELPAYQLKVLKEPDPALFLQGTHCKAIYSNDGEFYPCVVYKVTEEGYLVKYKKYNTQEVVKLHCLRPMKNQNQKLEEVQFDTLHEFRVPDKLKILPNDPENVKKSKKTKVKALKFAYKNAKVEEVNKEKQQKWKDWNSTGSGAKVGYFKTKHDIDTIHSKKD